MHNPFYKIAVILILFFFSTSYSYCQQSFTNAHGTLIFIATGKDGIMMAVDSRLTLTDKDKMVGIVDSVDKVYNLKGFIVCYEGTGILDSIKFVSSTFREYNALHKKAESFSIAVSGYINYLKTNYQKQVRNSLKDNVFIFAGFEKRKPYVIIWKPIEESSSFNAKDSVFECTDDKAKEYFGTYDPQSSCRQLAANANNAMNKFIDQDKSLKAGKPFRIIMIKPNNSVASLNKFRGTQLYTTKDFENAVTKKRVKVFMVKDGN